MKTYKFRGKRLDNDELIYGDLSTSIKPAIGDGKNWHLVDPESVVQFVGLDYDGNEIYEGDLLVQPTNVYNRRKAILVSDVSDDKLYKYGFFEYWVDAYMFVSGDKLKERKATLWRGKMLYPREGKPTSVVGELQIRANEFSPDRYDCFICDKEGLHAVDIASLERVADQ